MKSVASIGTANQDVYLLGDALKPVKDGKNEYIEVLLGAKIPMERVVFTTGGNASNSSVTFARQGLHSMFIGAVGNDTAGSAVKKELKLEDVDRTHFRKSEKYSTSYSAILLSPGGERTILTYKSNSYEYLEKFNYEKIKTDYAYISSVGTFGTLDKMFSTLKKNSVKIVYNPGSRELKQPEDLIKMIDGVHMLILNKDEAKILFNKATVPALLRAALEKVDYFVMTDGPNGVVATDGKKVVSGGMYEDVPVIDRLGAGDAFGSGFVASVAKGKTLEKALTFASANSTSVVQYIGAKEGILSSYSRIHSMPLEVTDLP